MQRRTFIHQIAMATGGLLTTPMHGMTVPAPFDVSLKNTADFAILTVPRAKMSLSLDYRPPGPNGLVLNGPLSVNHPNPNGTKNIETIGGLIQSGSIIKNVIDPNTIKDDAAIDMATSVHHFFPHHNVMFGQKKDGSGFMVPWQQAHTVDPQTVAFAMQTSRGDVGFKNADSRNMRIALGFTENNQIIIAKPHQPQTLGAMQQVMADHGVTNPVYLHSSGGMGIWQLRNNRMVYQNGTPGGDNDLKLHLTPV